MTILTQRPRAKFCPVVCCVERIKEDGSLNTEYYCKPSDKDQHLHFDSHNPNGKLWLSDWIELKVPSYQLDEFLDVNNISLLQGNVLPAFKMAIIKLTLKKPYLYPNDFL